MTSPRFAAGDAFIQLTPYRREVIRHTWIIISDPVGYPDQILLVNLTDARNTPDDACEFEPGAHPCVTKRSRNAYEWAETKSIEELVQAEADGWLQPQGRFSGELLKRIRVGAFDSLQIAFEWQDPLEEQGLARDDL